MLNRLKNEIHEVNVKNGFWDTFYSLPKSTDGKYTEVQVAFINQFLMLSVGELSEATEALRMSKYARKHPNIFDSLIRLSKTDPKVFKQGFKTQIKDSFEDEIADTMIRLLDLCSALDIDIENHISLKLKFNSMREHKHGKNF